MHGKLNNSELWHPPAMKQMRDHYINSNLGEDRLLVSAAEICQSATGNTSALGTQRQSARENLFICVVPPRDGQSHLQQSCSYGHTCLQQQAIPSYAPSINSTSIAQVI